MDEYQKDYEQMKANKKCTTFWIANRLAKKYKRLEFLSKSIWKRVLYLYGPVFIVTALCKPGSNSTMMLVGGICMIILWIGRMPIKELLMIIVIGMLGLGSMIGIYYASGGKVFKKMRIDTLVSRTTSDYDIYRLIDVENDPEHGKKSKLWYKVRDKIKQPYTARIAIRQGGLLGKGSGNSTQKYIVTHIYSDYVFSFIVEEYGLVGGAIVILLFSSLLARGALIAGWCHDNFAKIAVGGLTLMITAQAFLHIMVNVDIGFMTGQTLPLISDGRFAFIMFCTAFGIILSISKIAKKERDEAQAQLEREKNEN